MISMQSKHATINSNRTVCTNLRKKKKNKKITLIVVYTSIRHKREHGRDRKGGVQV